MPAHHQYYLRMVDEAIVAPNHPMASHPWRRPSNLVVNVGPTALLTHPIRLDTV